jgi:N-acyl-D-aspartate/D-glutamate deacylase
MTHDLIIRGGEVLDGTGAAAIRADIAIDGERIAAVGDLKSADARQEIDASGKIVTPGFVDLHTHFDAQIGWDPQLRPSSWHGVTSVLMGNCGVTFAPVKAEDRTYLAEIMESVEDIPAPAILDGLPWTWHTFGEYLDAISEMAPSLNVAGLVGHSPVRYYAMGDAACDEDAHPDPQQLAIMADLVGQAVADGAVGFSTSRLLGHKAPDGRNVPGTHAHIEEYEAILQSVMDAGGGMFQAVMEPANFAATDIPIMQRAAELGCQVLFSGGANKPEQSDNWRRTFAGIEAKGGRIASVGQVRASGGLIGIGAVTPVGSPEWMRLTKKIRAMADKAAELKKPEVVARLISEGNEKGLWFDPARIFPMGNEEVPSYSSDKRGKSVAQLAEEAGITPVELIVKRLCESEGRELFNAHMFSHFEAGSDSYLEIPQVIPGINDAGAHASQISDGDSFTYWLSERVRDESVASLPDAIRKITSLPASVLGLIDRGTLAPGQFADINVIDYARLQTGYPTMVYDFPHDAPHLITRAKGYAATLVNGVAILIDDELTGARPGKVQRKFNR